MHQCHLFCREKKKRGAFLPGDFIPPSKISFRNLYKLFSEYITMLIRFENFYIKTISVEFRTEVRWVTGLHDLLLG